MRDLQLFIEGIENEPFKTTQDWMDKMYAEYNEKLFNNELPKHITLKVLSGPEMKKIMGSDETLGCMGYGESVGFLSTGKYVTTRRSWHPVYEMENDMYIGTLRGKRLVNILDAKPHIYMNTKFDDLNQLQHEDTLIHEMIHLWVEKDGLFPKRAHGKEFKTKCDEVRKLAKEIYGKTYWLSTYADTSSNTAEETAQKQLDQKIWRLNSLMYLIYTEMKDGEIRLIFSDHKAVRKVYDEMLKQMGKENIKLSVMFNHCYRDAYEAYGNFSNSKKYRGYYKAAKYTKIVDWCKQILKEDKKYYYNVMMGTVDESKHTFQPEPDYSMAGFLVPADVDWSTFDVEEYIKSMEDADVEDVKGDVSNEKNFVEDK